MFGTSKYAGIKLTDSTVTYGKQGGSLEGCIAHVETVGQDIRHPTVRRAVLTGGLGLLVQKKTGRKTYLTVTGPWGQFVVDIDHGQDSAARTFAAVINTAVSNF